MSDAFSKMLSNGFVPHRLVARATLAFMLAYPGRSSGQAMVSAPIILWLLLTLRSISPIVVAAVVLLGLLIDVAVVSPVLFKEMATRLP